MERGREMGSERTEEKMGGKIGQKSAIPTSVRTYSYLDPYEALPRTSRACSKVLRTEEVQSKTHEVRPCRGALTLEPPI